MRIEQAQEEAEVSYQEADARLDKQNLFPCDVKFNRRAAPKSDASVFGCALGAANRHRESNQSCGALCFPLEFDICLEGHARTFRNLALGFNFEVYEEIEVKKAGNTSIRCYQ